MILRSASLKIAVASLLGVALAAVMPLTPGLSAGGGHGGGGGGGRGGGHVGGFSVGGARVGGVSGARVGGISGPRVGNLSRGYVGSGPRVGSFSGGRIGGVSWPHYGGYNTARVAMNNTGRVWSGGHPYWYRNWNAARSYYYPRHYGYSRYYPYRYGHGRYYPFGYGHYPYRAYYGYGLGLWPWYYGVGLGWPWYYSTWWPSYYSGYPYYGAYTYPSAVGEYTEGIPYAESYGTVPTSGGMPDMTTIPQPQTVQPEGTTEEESGFFADALTAFRDGDYANAVRLATHAAVDDPENPNVHLLLSLGLFAMGQYRPAAMEAHAVAALGGSPTWPQVYEFYDNLTTYTNQLRALEKYVRENLKAPEGRFLLGFQYMITGYKQDASNEFLAALQAMPNDKIAADLLTKEGGVVPPEIAKQLAKPPAAQKPEGTQPVAPEVRTAKKAGESPITPK